MNMFQIHNEMDEWHACIISLIIARVLNVNMFIVDFIII